MPCPGICKVALLALVLVWSQYAEFVVAEESKVQNLLMEAQRSINANTSAFCYHGHSGTKQAFISSKFSGHLHGQNAIVYPFCLVTNELGNRLGNYFSEIGCALASGMHFISVHHQWDISGSFHGNNTNTTYSSDTNKLAF